MFLKILWETPVKNPHMWMTLGWQEIVQSYRRSVLGPFWITLNLVIFATAMTLIYGALFGVPTKEYAAYVVTGMIAWFWVAALLTDVGNTFLSYGSFVKGMPLDKVQFVWAAAYKQLVILAHHLIVYVALIVIGIVHPSVHTIAAIPVFAVMFLLSVPITAIASILFTRFQDIQRLVTSMIIVFMMITPIFWQANMMPGWRSALIHLNPIWYLIEFMRRPLLGQPSDPFIVSVVVGMTIVLWIGGAMFYRRYHRYVVFWM